MTRRKVIYGAACSLPLVFVLVALGWLTIWGQDHTTRNCLRFVSTHVTTDVAAWKKLVCHG